MRPMIATWVCENLRRSSLAADLKAKAADTSSEKLFNKERWMCIYVQMYVYIHIVHEYMCISMHTYACVYMYIGTHMYVHVHLCACFPAISM